MKFSINWSEDHHAIIESNSLDEAIKVIQALDSFLPATFLNKTLDTSDCFECDDSGAPLNY